MKKQFKNYGVLLGEKSTDFHADVKAGALFYETRNPSGDYELWLPPGEWQANDNGDSMSCVSFGALNVIETEEKRQTGKQINYSDRWIAKMSETTRQGNYLWKVLDTIRKYGLVKEESYPSPAKYTWDEYHAEIPEPLLSKLKTEGQEWLKKWEVQYEWVDITPASIAKHLKHSPLIVVIPGHLVQNWRIITSVKDIFDSYPEYKKKVPGNYPEITHAMKIVLTPKDLVDPDALYVNLKEGDWGKEVGKLLRALRRCGWGYGMTENWPEVYDDKVKKLVFDFQKANLPRFGWSWWWAVWFRGSQVGSDTREVINNILKQK